MLEHILHLNPTFKIVRALEAKGHDIWYVGLQDGEEDVTSRGFKFHSIIVERLPKGYKQFRKQGFNVQGVVREPRKVGGYVKTYYEEITGEITKTVESLKPDLFVVDIAKPAIALVVKSLDVPCILVNTTLPSSRESMLPPANTDIIPEDTFGSRSRIAFEWKKNSAKRFVGDIAASLLVGVSPHGELKRLARNLRIRNMGNTFTPSRLNLEQIVLCPQELDFNRKHDEKVHFAEASIDLNRKEADFAWEEISGDKPLIYCSLGNPGPRADLFRKVMRTLIKAVEERPDLQLVVATGSEAKAEDFPSEAPNVKVVESAPQLKMLEKATVMVSHGGFNNIKEAIYFGVPLVVFAIAKDQSGNVARVAHHGVGLRGDAETVTVEALNSLIDRAMSEDAVKSKSQEMMKAFRQAEEQPTGAELIESALENVTRPMAMSQAV